MLTEIRSAFIFPFQARGKMVFISGENARDGVLGRVASGTRHCRPRYEHHFDDKNVRNIFERTQCGPKGGGQEARNNQGIEGRAFFGDFLFAQKKATRTRTRHWLRSKESKSV